MYEVRCIQQAKAILGESPMWCPRERCLYWVDIYRPAVYRFHPDTGQTEHWLLPAPVGCVTCATDGRVVIAGTGGAFYLDTGTGDRCQISDPEAGMEQHRFNDGKIDRRGRFWAGTLDERFLEGSGSLYRIEADGATRCMDRGFTCSNGIGWSPDNRIMYFTDSRAYVIWAYDFDLETGSIAGRRVFATFDPTKGDPDGLTVDSEGYVWSAIWNGWRVVRFAPDGTVDRTISMPVQRPTSCVFGGPEMKTLYVTSASYQLQSNDLKRGPLAGGLFAIQLDIQGLPETAFGSSLATV